MSISWATPRSTSTGSWQRRHAGFRAVPCTTPPMPGRLAGQTLEHARVVVIGGGITGCSVAYHLAEAGWTDVLLRREGAS